MKINIGDRHPVLLQKYAVYTPPMEKMFKIIGDWIDQRLSGGQIYGPSRFGKTEAINWHLMAILEMRFKRKVPLVKWVRRDSVMSEVEFWNTLLGAAKYEFHNPLVNRPKVAAKFLFEQQLVTLAKKARGNYVILLIDEAQAVTLKEWMWLLGLQNSLNDQGIRFSIFSIGSYELQYEPDYLARTGNAHIAARFFVSDARFYGIRSPRELGYVLNGYDTESKWPLDSNISYLQYFAPNDFTAGRRLQDHTEHIWSAFKELLPPGMKFKPGTTLEIPMLHISGTIECVLRRLGSGEAWESVTEYKSWLQMVAGTRFTDFMRKIS